jgi:multiple sugar transport system permease protein
VRRLLHSAVLHLALVIVAGLTLAPLLWMVFASLRPTGMGTDLTHWPTTESFTLSSYREIFTRLRLAHALVNSTLVAAAVTVIALLFNSMAGYAFAKLRFRFREPLFRILSAALVIPAQVAMLPLFLLIKELGLVNTYAGVIIPGMASVFGIFLIRQYALSIPDSLLDAARVDGAGELRIYWSLVLPLCKPILVTLGIFTFLGAWNDFLWPLVVLSDSHMYTLPVALANLVGEHVQDVELMMAGAVLTVLPPLLTLLLLQRYYVAGIMAGGVKE